jgi:hypothetical protein
MGSKAKKGINLSLVEYEAQILSVINNSEFRDCPEITRLVLTDILNNTIKANRIVIANERNEYMKAKSKEVAQNGRA